MVRLIAGTATLAAVPTVALLAMVLAGAASPWPALAAGVATIAAAAAAARARAVEIERLTQSVSESGRRLDERASQIEALSRANEAIVERLPDPLLVLGADRALHRANAAARAIFGADIGAVVRHPGLRGAIDRALQTRRTQEAELHLPVPVARDVQASVLVMDPPLADGAVAIVVLSDRTRERAVERTRADFVANASHELRTPLASMIGFVDTLRGPAADDPPAQQRFLAIMAEQGARMNRLIDDLLSLSRIEITEHQTPSQRIDLADIVAGVAAALEPRVADRAARLELSFADALPPVLADRDQMTQLVTNLVDNAVKYGREGGSVRVSLASAPPGGRFPTRPGVLLGVGDDGPGIPRRDIPRLTERFYRVDKGRSRAAGGTGLGLAIVKHIVNRHRGQLVIESEEGVGSTFSVWLPVAAEP